MGRGSELKDGTTEGFKSNEDGHIFVKKGLATNCGSARDMDELRAFDEDGVDAEPLDEQYELASEMVESSRAASPLATALLRVAFLLVNRALAATLFAAWPCFLTLCFEYADRSVYTNGHPGDWQ